MLTRSRSRIPKFQPNVSSSELWLLSVPSLWLLNCSNASQHQPKRDEIENRLPSSALAARAHTHTRQTSSGAVTSHLRERTRPATSHKKGATALQDKCVERDDQRQTERPLDFLSSASLWRSEGDFPPFKQEVATALRTWIQDTAATQQ